MQKPKYTPMMEQYLEIKSEYKDAILFFRLGDFYEMFFDDAHIASKELELALTGKDAGAEERVPMCGVPYHAADAYIEKLVSRGYKVAIAEQIEDPKAAVGIVKRGVIKIITPGTIDSGIKDDENNFLGAISYVNKSYLLAYCDITTGEGSVCRFKTIDNALSELLSLHIKELIVEPTFSNIKLYDFAKINQIIVSYEENTVLNESLTHVVKNLDSDYYSLVGMLLNYFIKLKKQIPMHLKEFKCYESNNYLRLDGFSKRNLELTETLRFGSKNGSLLWHLDKCQTAMGSRMLANFIDKPLRDLDLINERLDFVEAFNNNFIIKEEIRKEFKNVYDLERIIGRIASNSANAKDLGWLKRSLEAIPKIKAQLSLLDYPNAKMLANNINAHEEIYEMLDKALVDNPPLSVKEGGIIKDGYSNTLDEIRSISANSKAWILDYETKERQKLGVKTLKVGYNRVTGYFIEISKLQSQGLNLEEYGYERRATLANSERYITEELKHYEQIVINAKEQIESLEYELFANLRKKCQEYIKSLQDLAYDVALIDVYIAFSVASIRYNYVRPTFNDKGICNIVDGRHPVLETLISDNYIVNDVVINKYNMMLLTGPNMSGKSTYMRMLACIIVMAQIGCFVPARVANLTIFDQIFTRIGASDDLVSGQSTFMVEMLEANHAISNATKQSLILFDEIGRGTATYDGMALAQGILEYLHEKVCATTIFSTHYHELTALEGKLSKLKNIHVEAKDEAGKIVFLHKVIDGPTDKSYGINVASLAGLPKSLIKRSKDILDSLEADSNNKKAIGMDLFNFDSYIETKEDKEDIIAKKIRNRIDEIDINRLTPLEALNILYELKEFK